MSTTPRAREILTLPVVLAIDYARYLLLLPTIAIWALGVFLAVSSNSMRTFELLLTPLLILLYAIALVDPTFEITPDGDLDGLDTMAGVARIVFAGGLILWAVAALWRAVWRRPPKIRSFGERCRNVGLMAVGAGTLMVVGFLTIPSTGDGQGQVAGAIVMSIVFLVAMAISGWWAVLVGTTADALSHAVSGTQRTEPPGDPNRTPSPNSSP
jgi:hypothetical protein